MGPRERGGGLTEPRRASGEEKGHVRIPKWFRTTEVVLGLFSSVVAIVVMANPEYGTSDLVALLAVVVTAGALRMLATGRARRSLARLEALGHVGAGLLVLALAAAVLLFPDLGFRTLVLLISVALCLQGVGRFLQAAGRDHPLWMRGSAAATGAFTLGLVGVALLVPGPANFTLVAILSLIVLVNGLEAVVSGLRPSNRRQMMLLKLILFSAAYGLILINWIDLFAVEAPAYHIWLILTYMAPFGVLVVFQGLKDWELALSLGLLVSLMNDVGYYFTADLLFGQGKPLIPFLAGQFGFKGWDVLFTFQGGAFNIPVTSILMGLSIYGRMAVVGVVLYHWWKSPVHVNPRA